MEVYQESASRTPIPEDLAELRQFVAWKYGRMRDGKPEKLPVDPHTGRQAKTSDPNTWGTLEEASRRAEENGLQGVGFVFTANDPFAGVDLDGCRNPETCELAPWASRLVSKFDSYAEVSPSGTGVKIVVRGELKGKGNRRGPVEIYDRGRFFTLTGDVLGNHGTIEARQEVLKGLHNRVGRGSAQVESQRPQNTIPVQAEDEELIERARNAGNGQKFRRLYDEGDIHGYASASEAELALAGILAFWTGRDRKRMGRLMRASALRREKWDTHPYYLENTVELAASRCQRVYTPKPCAEGEVHRILEGLKEYAVLDPWTGRSGPRERWLYNALIDTGGGYGKVCPDGVIVAAGSRDLALKCGTKRTTVESLMGKLEERGLVRLLEKGRGRKASKYLLLRPPLRGGHKENAGVGCGETLTYNPLCLLYGPLLARLRDAAPQTVKQFDKNGRKIPQDSSHVLRSLGGFRALIMEKIVAWPGMALTELASALGRDLRTVEENLPMLVEGGFVDDAGETYSCPEDLADLLLDELRDSGCSDREDRLRATYERDRAEYEKRRREKRLEAVAIECGLEPEPDGYTEDLEHVEDPVITDANDPEQLHSLAAMIREAVARRDPSVESARPFRWPYDPGKAEFYRESRERWADAVRAHQERTAA